MEIASQIGHVDVHEAADEVSFDDGYCTPTYFYKNVIKLALNKLCVY